MMIVLMLGGGFFLFVALAIAAWFLLSDGASSSPGGSAASIKGIPANVGTLKDEVPAVASAVVGEKATDVKTYFSSMYPGAKVVTNGALPAASPAFKLITDGSGTITGVDANEAAWK